MDLTNFEVLQSSWLPDNHIAVLNTILQGCSTHHLEKRLVNYVVENIEPIGWKAIWRSPGTSPDLFSKLKRPLDFIVEVKDVSHNFLEANVSLCLNEQDSLITDDMEKEFVAPLTELHPLADQDNDLLNISTTTEVIEQIRFIYKNIWMPWDSYSEQCFYSQHLIESRMKTFQDMENGTLPPPVASEMRAVVSEAAALRLQIKELEEKSGVAFEEEVDERDIVQLLKLHSEMERLKAEYETLKDPTLRELAHHKKQVERRSLLSSTCDAGILVVCGNAPLGAFEAALSRLSDFVSALPSVPSSLRVQTLPSLQLALDTAKVGDVIVLLEGSYKFKNLGLLSKGGTICCKGGYAEIIQDGCQGDVTFDLKVEEGQKFVLQSVAFRTPSHPQQISIALHQGDLVLKDCSFKGAGVAAKLLSGTNCTVTDCSFSKCATSAIECRVGSSLRVQKVELSECQRAALMLDDGASLEVVEALKIAQCPRGVAFARPDSSAGTSEDVGAFVKRCIKNDERIAFEDVGTPYTVATCN